MNFTRGEISILVEIIKYSKKTLALTGVQDKNLDSITNKLQEHLGNNKEFNTGY